MTSRTGGPKAPYTTGYINTAELHFVKRLAHRERADGHTCWEMECGRFGPVTDLADRTVAEVLAIEEICSGCIVAAWVGQLAEEATADGGMDWPAECL